MQTDLATARCCKSAAPTNLTMLQHCTVKEIQHFKLANLPTLQLTLALQLALQLSHLLPSKAVTWQSCNIANLPKSNTPSLKGCKATKSTGQTTPSHWPRLPSYTNLHRVPTAGLGCRTDLATARCWKSAAPTNLTMLQHCTVKQIHTLNLPTCPCCTDTASFQLVAKQSCHLVATLQICQSPTLQAFRLKATKSTGQTTPSHWPEAAQLHQSAQGSNCRSWLQNRSGHCKMLQICSPCHPDHAPNCTALPCCTDTASFQLVAKQSCHLQGCNIANQPKSTLQALGLKATKSTGQTTPTHWPEAAQLHQSAQGSNCRSCLQNRSGHCKMLQICSPYQPHHAPTLHCQGNLTDTANCCQSPQLQALQG